MSRLGNKRFQFIIDDPLRTTLLEKIPYGSLSAILRGLLTAYIDLCVEEGTGKVLIATLNGRIKLNLLKEKD